MNGEFKEYGNLAGNSGVKKYGLMDDGTMIVMFKDGSVYVYPYIINQGHVGNMLILAKLGRGLATYIAREKPFGVKAALVFGVEFGAANDNDGEDHDSGK